MRMPTNYSHMTESEIISHNDRALRAAGFDPDAIRATAAASVTATASAVASAPSWEDEPLVLAD
jgi:hypothetical protein